MIIIKKIKNIKFIKNMSAMSAMSAAWTPRELSLNSRRIKPKFGSNSACKLPLSNTRKNHIQYDNRQL